MNKTETRRVRRSVGMVLSLLTLVVVAAPADARGPEDSDVSVSSEIELVLASGPVLGYTTGVINDTSALDVFAALPPVPATVSALSFPGLLGPEGPAVPAIDPPDTVAYRYTMMATSSAGNLYLGEVCPESAYCFTFVPNNAYINSLGASVTETFIFTFTESILDTTYTVTVNGAAEATLIVAREDDLTSGLDHSSFSVLVGSTPDPESVDKGFDDNTATKYLNRAGEEEPVDATIDMGEAVVVDGIGLTTANDAPGRDPIAISLYGAATPFSALRAGTLLLSASTSSTPALTTTSARGADYGDLSFANTQAFRYYQVVFEEVASPGSVDSMQVAEVRLSGLRLADAPSYRLGGAPATISAGMRLIGDSPFTTVTVQITDGLNPGFDLLDIANLPEGVSKSYDSGTGLLTLTSTSALSNAVIQDAVRLVTYSSTASSVVVPKASRTLTFELTAQDDTTSSATIDLRTADRDVDWSATPTSITYGQSLAVTAEPTAGSGVVSYTTSGNCLYTAGELTASTAASPAACTLDAEVGEDGTFTTVSARVPLTLNILKAAATVTAPSPTVVAGDEAGTLTATVTGFVNGDTALDTPATCITTYTVDSPAGTYPVTCSGASDSDYTLTYVAGTLTAGTGSPPPPPPTTTTVPTTTVPPSTTTPPTTTLPPATTVPAPVPADPDSGELPTLTPGDSQVLDDGVPVDVEIVVETVDTGDGASDTATSARSELVMRGGDFELRLSGECLGGCAIDTDDQGRQVLQLEDDGGVQVNGDGFQAGSTVFVWIFSDPQFVGELTVDEDGTFTGSLPLPDVPVGDHTLQVNGISSDGQTRSANLGVVVEAAPASDTPTGQPVELPATGSKGALGIVSLIVAMLGAMVLVTRRRLTGRNVSSTV